MPSPSSLLLLLLSSSLSSAWPQLSVSISDRSSDRPELPQLPYTHLIPIDPRQLPDIDVAHPDVHNTLPVPPKDRRSLPAEDAGALIKGTLPVPLSRLSRHRRASSKDDVELASTLPVPVRLANRNAEPDVPPGVLTMPVVRSVKPGLTKRDAIESPLANRSDIAYYAKLAIGTPPQNVYVQVDTGSFELWVNPTCGTSPTPLDSMFCQEIGRYNQAQSSTATSLRSSTLLRYGIGQARINYVRDSLGLAGATQLENVQFGVGSATSDLFSGIFGLGYGHSIATDYPTFLDELVKQSITETRAFAMGLGSKDEADSILVFGGLDTSKFSGSLRTLPIVPARNSPDGVPRYWVEMEGLTINHPHLDESKLYDNSSMTVFIDSGATLTLLPQELADTVAEDFGGRFDDEIGMYRISCDALEVDGLFDFAFDGITIRVPFYEMMRLIPTSPPQCFLGITPHSDFALLGDNFMRSAYIVFDPDNHTISLAQYRNCGRSLMTLSANTDMSSIRGKCSESDTPFSTDGDEKTDPNGDGDSVQLSPSETPVATDSTDDSAGVSLSGRRDAWSALAVAALWAGWIYAY